MPDRQPDSGEDEPYDVAKRAQRAGTDVVRLLEFLPTDGFLAEGEEGEVTNDEAGFAPRDADDGHERDHANEPPRKAHQRTAQNKPQKIADCAHRSVPRVQTLRLPVVACEIRLLGLSRLVVFFPELSSAILCAAFRFPIPRSADRQLADIELRFVVRSGRVVRWSV